MRILRTDDVMAPVGSYSQGTATAAGETVYVSGQVPTDRDGTLVGPGDIRAQTRQVLQNVEAVLTAAGASLTDVVKTTVYLRSTGDGRGFDEEYATYFGDHRPARVAIRAEMMSDAFLVEVDAIAVIQG